MCGTCDFRLATETADPTCGSPHIDNRELACLMNPSIISGLAALAGAIIGGLASLLASSLAQHTQARASWISQDRSRRQDVYKEFIEEASSCYIDALQHDNVNIPALVTLYTKIGRMRVLSSPKVLATAETIGRKILDTYLQPNKTIAEFIEMVKTESFDLIRDFSEACREEFDSLRAQQFDERGARSG